MEPLSEPIQKLIIEIVDKVDWLNKTDHSKKEQKENLNKQENIYIITTFLLFWF